MSVEKENNRLLRFCLLAQLVFSIASIIAITAALIFVPAASRTPFLISLLVAIVYAGVVFAGLNAIAKQHALAVFFVAVVFVFNLITTGRSALLLPEMLAKKDASEMLTTVGLVWFCGLSVFICAHWMLARRGRSPEVSAVSESSEVSTESE